MSYKKIRDCLVQVKLLLTKNLFVEEDTQNSVIYLQRARLLANAFKQTTANEDEMSETIVDEINAFIEFFSNHARVVTKQKKIAQKLNDLIAIVDQVILTKKSAQKFFYTLYPELPKNSLFFRKKPQASAATSTKPQYIFHVCLDVDDTISINNPTTEFLNEVLLKVLQKLKIKFEGEQHQVQFHLLTNRRMDVMFQHARDFLMTGMTASFEKIITSFVADRLHLRGLPIAKVASLGDLFPQYNASGTYYSKILTDFEKKLVEFLTSYKGENTDAAMRAEVQKFEGFGEYWEIEQSIMKSGFMIEQLRRAFPAQKKFTLSHYKAALFHQLRSQLEQENNLLPIYIIFEDQPKNVAALRQYAVDKSCAAITIQVDPFLGSEQDYIETINLQLQTLMSSHALKIDQENFQSAVIF